MKLRSTYSLGILAMLLLAGCMVGQKYQKPETAPAITYRDTAFTDTSSLVRWFDLYQDEALRGMIKNTLDSNLDLLTTASRLEEARLQTAIIKANLYPHLGYSAEAGGGSAGTEAQKVAGGVQGGSLKAYGVLNWELDIWGKVRHASRSALAEYLSLEQNRNALVVSLVAEVATDYFLLRDLDNRLEIARQTLKNRKEYTKIISDRFEKGYVPELDKLQAIQQEQIAAATIPSLQRQIVQTENAVRLLMGMGPGPVPRDKNLFEQTVSPNIPVGLPSQLLERRPDIMESEKIMESQFERIGVAQANRFPSLSLTGILGFASPALGTFIGSQGFVANGFADLAGPVFNFGQLKNQVGVERRRFDQAYYQYRRIVLAAFGDVDNSLSYYKTFTEEYEARRLQAAAAEKALRLSQARYNEGYTSYLEVVVSENSLFDAQFQASSALQGKLNSIVLLYKSLGGGWQ